MSVRIEILGETAGDALGKLRDLSAGLAGGAASIAPVVRGDGSSNVAEVPAAPATAPEPVAETPKRTRTKKAEAPAQAPQPEPAEVQAQDAADEAAEEGTAEPDRVYTIDDVRRLAGEYTKKFGLPAAQEDGKRIFEKHGHKSKLSDMTDPAVIAAVVTDFEAALNDNIFARKEVG